MPHSTLIPPFSTNLIPISRFQASAIESTPHCRACAKTLANVFALQSLRKNLGQRYPLVINNKPVSTNDWLPSLNPANQTETIGYAAQASIAEADSALAATRAAQPKWARTPAAERAVILEKVTATRAAQPKW